MTELLAICGGEPTVPPGAIRPWPHITDEDREAVAQVLAHENIGVARNELTHGLAADFAGYIGVRHCIPTNSGTSALHMAVVSLGIGAGDEVLVPAFTFWASAAAVLHHNAIPVFVDIDPVTFNIDPSRLEEKISERTKAIMVVHIHGLPADMDEILAIAESHGLAVIEDVAQAHGAQYKGRMCGSIGDVAGFSTQMSKVLTSGSEGGLFVTNDESYYKAAALLQNFGEEIDASTSRQEREYNAVGLGWMYRGDVFGQAFVRSQLRRLDEYNDRRIENCEYITEQLADTPGVMTPLTPPDRKGVYYNYVIGFSPSELGLDMTSAELRDRVQAALNAEGISAAQWQTMPVPAQEIFQRRFGYGDGCPWACRTNTRSPSDVRYRADDYPCTVDFIDSHTYLLDIHPPNGLELMGHYVEAIQKVMRNIDQIPEPEPGMGDKVMAARNPWEYVG